MSKRIMATYYETADPYLLSGGRYKTKIKPEDMPPWYLHGLFYGYKDGFLQTKGVDELFYRPNLFTNHMFKDDFLFISYKYVKPGIKSVDNFCPIPYSEYIWGWNIPPFLVMAERYSGYDISKILDQIQAKQDWFRLTYPDDYARELGGTDAITRINKMRGR